MIKQEELILESLKKNFNVILLGVITVISLMVRIVSLGFVSEDASVFLLPWYDQIKEMGINCLSHQIGDYNILYQFIIYVFTLIPIEPLYAYKFLSIIFDYMLAVVLALIYVDCQGTRIKDSIDSSRFVMVYSAVIMCPIVFLNSSCWAQCDSIYTFFVFASLYAYLKKRYTLMFILYGMAFAFKLQAIFALPLILIIYLVEKKFSILKLLYIPLMLFVTSLPGIIMGRSIFAPFEIYMNQTNEFRFISWNCHSFWICLTEGFVDDKPFIKELCVITILFTICILGLIVLVVFKRNIRIDRDSMLYLLHITVYTCVLFFPCMHERYGYIYVLTAILLIFVNKKLFFPGIGVIMLSCLTYGFFLFDVVYPTLVFSIINTLIYGWYVYVFLIANKNDKNIDVSAQLT